MNAFGLRNHLNNGALKDKCVFILIEKMKKILLDRAFGMSFFSSDSTKE